MATLANIYGDLVNALTNIIDGKYIFLSERPNVNSETTQMTSFVVVDLPTTISDVALGNHRFLLTTTGVIYVFVKAKRDNTLNVNAMSSLVESVIQLFPISGTYSVATEPEILGKGADGNGYHVTSISFTLHTKKSN